MNVPAFSAVWRQAGNGLAENLNGYCPNHRTGVALPDLEVTPLQYVK